MTYCELCEHDWDAAYWASCPGCQIRSLNTERADLRAALGFYAEYDNYCPEIIDPGSRGAPFGIELPSLIAQDGGKLARAKLENRRPASPSGDQQEKP